jgi:UDP-N-acetylmuramate: L-alanyl-gamma-D-glutamyl-meso-diaminopimelate ligase
LEKVFADADEVLLGPVHRKETIPEDDRLDTKALAKAIQRTGIFASSYDDIDNIVAYIDGTLQKDDIILIMSNGAFGGIYDRFRALPTD